MNWILKSNIAFDKWEWWKFIALLIAIIGTTYADNLVFNGTPIFFGIIFSIFVIWRMFGMNEGRKFKSKNNK